jgi:beta-xylosidase
MTFTLSRLFLRLLCFLCLFVANLFAADGTYTNPIIDADCSDPDVIRVGDDFYLSSRRATNNR